MTQNIPLAVILVTVGSFCFAMSAHLQHGAVDKRTDGNAEKERLSSHALWESIKSPRWLIGLMCMGISLLLQITALTMAPVSVVQPVGLLAFPWSIILQSVSKKQIVPPPIIGAVAMTVVATVSFTVITGLHASPASELTVSQVMIGAMVVYLLAIVMGYLGTQGPQQWRCLFWSSGGAFFYGLEAALAKSLIEFARTHDWAHDVGFWAIAVALVLGSASAGWMIQQGYATGAPELVVASMTITSPVIAVAFGIAVLGEGARLTPIAVLLMLACGLVAVGGVVLLSVLHQRMEAKELAA